jgi:hypothetical protein
MSSLLQIALVNSGQIGGVRGAAAGGNLAYLAAGEFEEDDFIDGKDFNASRQTRSCLVELLLLCVLCAFARDLKELRAKAQRTQRNTQRDLTEHSPKLG